MIKTTIPRVKVIKQPDLTLALDAWLHSRPNEAPENVGLQNILKIDAPVAEFPRVTAQFYAPILVREIVCTLRDHVVWARTSRVDDLTNWEVHPLAHTDATRDLLAELLHLRAAGAEQDDYRFNLPLGYMTHFTVDLPLRSWLNLAHYFGRLTQKALSDGDDICELWAQMNNQMLARLYPEWLRDVRYKDRELCPEWELGENVHVGSMIVADALVPIALRAQVVRHRMFMIADDLSDFFSAEALSLPISTNMNLQIAAPREVAQQIVAKRQCWIAQSDIWQPLILQLQVALNTGDKPTSSDGTDAPTLPCDDGVCPYRRDNDLRRFGKDPNPPCPKAAILEGVPMSAADREKAKAHAMKRATSNFWLDQIQQEEDING